MNIKAIHRAAMEANEAAIFARRSGDHKQFEVLVKEAFELEKSAAEMLRNDLQAEPTRGILYRSAATLAKECGFFHEAETLIYTGLSGSPVSSVEVELQDLLEEVSFHRHLQLRDIVLGEDEIQLAVTGKSIGFGVAPAGLVASIVQKTESLLYRIAERKSSRPYRERGARDARIAEGVELFMAAPRAACFALTLRVGEKTQASLPGLSPSQEIVDELIECLDLYNKGDQVALRTRITEDAYLRNFVGLADSIRPDGERIATVGFTSLRRGKAKSVALRPAVNLQSVTFPASGRSQPTKQDVNEGLTITGILLMADAKKKLPRIEIVGDGGNSEKIIVPEGMMSDIVRPLWEKKVQVLVNKRGSKFYLVQIREI
jgi:hypothetical protein